MVVLAQLSLCVFLEVLPSFMAEQMRLARSWKSRASMTLLIGNIPFFVGIFAGASISSVIYAMRRGSAGTTDQVTMFQTLVLLSLELAFSGVALAVFVYLWSLGPL
jgi:hypothetical protein